MSDDVQQIELPGLTETLDLETLPQGSIVLIPGIDPPIRPKSKFTHPSEYYWTAFRAFRDPERPPIISTGGTAQEALTTLLTILIDVA